ncbi:MAG: trypsin-like peptidase domain-containing protein [Cytophagales bacterium]|nr:trypsin-like peptidase domain-containing protein [Cytophagales bacterium]
MLIIAGAIGAVIALSVDRMSGRSQATTNGQDNGLYNNTANPTSNVNYGASGNRAESVDSVTRALGAGFGNAAEQSLEQVVHIRATSRAQRRQYDPFQEFFGGGSPFEGDPRQQGMQQQATGSGVIIRPDGYIVTNNHVVDGATDLEVSLYNKRVYKAKILGRDPATDLALIKINEQGLPAARFANSEQVRVGDWVLAVGNPFDLASTVTAGIISAKARSIHIREDNSGIESFLQTDAAVNPGNSGGALVNLSGDLVGINTAIASPTGTYAGYAFAVPSNIVSKVVDDILRYGEVRRAYLGVSIQDVDGTLAQDLKLQTADGVLVAGVVQGGAAAAAGLQRGDVITAINNRPVRSSPELLETVATRRPGDKVTLTVNRDGRQQQIPLTLKGSASIEAARTRR